MYSITFTNGNGSKNTWTDWMLIPTSRPVANPPEMKTHYVDIPGRNGTIDLSTFLTGEPSYENRVGTWEFIVCNHNILVSGLDTIHVDDNSKWIDFDIPERDWMDVKSEIMMFFNYSLATGELTSNSTQTYVHFPDDPDDLYLLGRIYLKDWRNDEQYSMVTLDYNLLPFRFANGHSEAAISIKKGGVL